jgi:hypothetical protein
LKRISLQEKLRRGSKSPSNYAIDRYYKGGEMKIRIPKGECCIVNGDWYKCDKCFQELKKGGNFELIKKESL